MKRTDLSTFPKTRAGQLRAERELLTWVRSHNRRGLYASYMTMGTEWLNALNRLQANGRVKWSRKYGIVAK